MKAHLRGISTVTAVIIVIAILVVGVAAGLTVLNMNPGASSSSSTAAQSSTLANTSSSSKSTYLMTNSSSLNSSSSSSVSTLESNSSSSLTTTANLTTTSSSSTYISSSSNPSGNSFKVIANVAVGGNPFGIAYDPSNGYLYALNYGSLQCAYRGNECGYVSVIDGSTNSIVANISSGFFSPQGIAYDSSNGLIYVANSYSNNLSIINPSTNRVTGYVQVGCSSFSVYFEPNNGYLYVPILSCSYNTVLVVSGVSNTVVGNITGGLWNPDAFTYDSSNGYLYAANTACNNGMGGGECGNISVIDTSLNNVIDQIGPLGSPRGIAFDPLNGYVYVASALSGSVTIINGATNSVLSSISVGGEPQSVVFDPQNDHLFVTNFPGSDSVNGHVTVIDGAANLVIGNVTVGHAPLYGALDTSNGYIYVSNELSGTVSVISQESYSIGLNPISVG